MFFELRPVQYKLKESGILSWRDDVKKMYLDLNHEALVQREGTLD